MYNKSLNKDILYMLLDDLHGITCKAFIKYKARVILLELVNTNSKTKFR